MGDQAGALVGPGRAAERVGRRRHDDRAAILHRLELAAQQQRLRAGLPGMRHALGGGLVVAGQRVQAEIDAGREHQPVVGERRAVAERDLRAGRDRPPSRRWIDDLDAVLARAPS